jgi:hypothetical protein
MTEAVTHVEKFYSTYVIKCEIVDEQQKEFDKIIDNFLLKL